MNDLIHTDGIQTMSSREIADLTGKEHRNVLRDVRDMLVQLHGEGGLLNFERSYLNAQNKPQPEYLLPKRETLILVSGYKLELRARIIDRWQELEARAADPMQALNDPATMRHLLLGYTEKVIALETQKAELENTNAKLAPKAGALDRIAMADGSLTVTDTAKALQIRPKDLFATLSQRRWIYRRHGTGWLGYQDKVQQGLLEHKVTTVQRADGSERITEQVRITPKGIARLAETFGIDGGDPIGVAA